MLNHKEEDIVAQKNVPAKNLCSNRYRLQVVKPKKGKGSYSRKNASCDQ